MERNLQAYQNALNQTKSRLQNAEASIGTLQTWHSNFVSYPANKKINDQDATIRSKDAELTELGGLTRLGPSTNGRKY